MTELNELLEHLWELLGDVPTNDDDEIDEDFMCWPKGTHREDIWRVFDAAHEKGVAYLMYKEQNGEEAETWKGIDLAPQGIRFSNPYMKIFEVCDGEQRVRLTQQIEAHGIIFLVGQIGTVDANNLFAPNGYPPFIKIPLGDDQFEAIE